MFSKDKVFKLCSDAICPNMIAILNTKKLFTDKCSFYEVPIVICSSKEELGHAIGKASRASIAVTEQGLANAIAK